MRCRCLCISLHLSGIFSTKHPAYVKSMLWTNLTGTPGLWLALKVKQASLWCWPRFTQKNSLITRRTRKLVKLGQKVRNVSLMPRYRCNISQLWQIRPKQVYKRRNEVCMGMMLCKTIKLNFTPNSKFRNGFGIVRIVLLTWQQYPKPAKQRQESIYASQKTNECVALH